MPSAANSPIAIGTYYEARSDDPGFAALTEQFKIDAANDGALAEFIEAEGRERIRRNLPVNLSRYLAAIPRLTERIDPLDAAIDMSMRWLARAGLPDDQSVEKLVAQHPALEKEIRESAVLSNAVWSTTELRTDLAATRIVKALPCAFGPVIGSGRRYELEDLLGEGAFGKVFLATDNQLSEDGHAASVSIKVFAGEEVTPWARQRFVEEATKARRIDHPNVVRVLDRGVTDEDEEFIVHEFVGGGDLSKWSRRRPRPIPVRKSVRLIAGVARGVHAAHMAGLVHCDLKPGNIMMTADGTPKVADFGIAIRLAEEAPAGADRLHQPRGNLAFISPEQYRQEFGALTVPSDIYALGGMLFWLLTDKLPNGSTPEEIERHHNPSEGRVEPPSMQGHESKVDPDLQAICTRAMATAPAERYASAQALADDLDAWDAREPIPWTRPSIPKRLRLWSRRKPALAVATACILLLAIGGAVMGAVANERRIEAEAAKARNAQTRKIALAFKAKLQKDMEAGATTDLLPRLWAMEWFFGPEVMGDPAKRPDFWGLRIDIVRRTITDAEAAGRGADIDTLLWKSALAFWLVSAGDHEEATPLIDETITASAGFVPASSRWAGELEVLRLCAGANALIAAVGDRSLTDTERSNLAALVQDIRRAGDDREHGGERGSPAHTLLLRTELRACDAALLNRPGRAEEIAGLLATLEQE